MTVLIRYAYYLHASLIWTLYLQNTSISKLFRIFKSAKQRKSIWYEPRNIKVLSCLWLIMVATAGLWDADANTSATTRIYKYHRTDHRRYRTSTICCTQSWWACPSYIAKTNREILSKGWSSPLLLFLLYNHLNMVKLWNCRDLLCYGCVLFLNFTALNGRFYTIHGNSF